MVSPLPPDSRNTASTALPSRRSTTGVSEASTVAITPHRERRDYRLRVHDLLGADRERGGQIVGHAVEERAGKRVAERHADKRGQDAEGERLEGEQQQHLPPVIPLNTQIGDEPAALGHRQQHRVQRQQESRPSR